MKATGIVRRIDDLGRIVIPKEMRKNLRIREGDPLEVFIDQEGNIVLRKYSFMSNLTDIAEEYIQVIYDLVKKNIIVTDRDKVIAAVGPLKNKYLGKSISEELINSIDHRDNLVQRHDTELKITEENSEHGKFVLSTIIANGDAIGLVILFSNDEKFSEIEEKVTQIAAQFLGKHVED